MLEVFKGYVPVRNKKCTMPFRNKTADELLTQQEADTHEEYAGILGEDTALIDIDDAKTSAILMRIVEENKIACMVNQTTRGLHFFFSNEDRVLEKNKIKARLAVGIQADIKLGCRNSYAVVKKDGVERETVYDVVNDDGEYDTVPKWLIPVSGKQDFLSMGEGDGRNQELFNYILTLQGAGFSKDESRETITLLNNFVLRKPLKKKELETILRDDAFQAPIFYNGKEFLHNKFAQFLISEHNLIKIGNVLHHYQDGVYVPVDVEHLMLKHIDKLKQAQRREVLAYLHAFLHENKNVASSNYIAFKNGVYNLSTRELEPHSTQRVITNLIPWDFVEGAEDENIDALLDNLSCGDSEIRALLEEMVGYLFLRRNELRKSFMLLGERHNGKSTFLDVLHYLLGEQNTSALDLGDLSHEYKTADLFGKLANLGDDIESEFIPNVANFKKIVSGDKISANVKYERPITFNPYCKLIFSSNSIPRIGRGVDASAILDRIIIIPFNASFNNDSENYNPFIKDQLKTQKGMEYLIQIGIRGLLRVLEHRRFTASAQSEQELREYELTLNPLALFFEEVSGDEIENHVIKDVYFRYQTFCVEAGVSPLGRNAFTRRVCKEYGFKSKPQRLDGVILRFFVKE